MSRSAPASSFRDSCHGCGGYVSTLFRRVFGDSQDRAHRCLECDTKRRVEAGSAAGRDVPVPDPQDQPGRQRGESA